jgi:Zn-finger nucleic acid-binding protein
MTGPYRESSSPCPRCGTAIAPVKGRSKWRCPSCVGTLVEEAELSLIRGWTGFVVRAPTDTPLECPLCADDMASVTVVDIALDYCARDRVVWCDSGELGRVRTAIAKDALVVDPRSLVAILFGSDGDAT